MKSLVSSTAIIVILIAAWLVFAGYSDSTVDRFVSYIDDNVSYNIEGGNWDDAIASFNALKDDWKKYRHAAEYFLSTDDLNEIECVIAKAEKNIELKDVSGASGELAVLKELLTILNTNERLILGNIL